MNECNEGPKPHSKSLPWHHVLPFSLSLFCLDCILWGLLWYFPKFCKSLKIIKSFSFLGILRTSWYKISSNRKIWAILCWAAGVPTVQQRNLHSPAAPGVSGNGKGWSSNAQSLSNPCSNDKHSLIGAGHCEGLYLPLSHVCLDKAVLFRGPAPLSLTDFLVCFCRPEDYTGPEQELDLVIGSHKCKIIFLPNAISLNKELSSLNLLTWESTTSCKTSKNVLFSAATFQPVQHPTLKILESSRDPLSVSF